MHFLGCLFVFILGGIFFVIAVISWVFRTLFGVNIFAPFFVGSRRKASAFNSAERNDNTTSEQQRTTHYNTGNAHHEGGQECRASDKGKIFDKSEGEYVDFEEV